MTDQQLVHEIINSNSQKAFEELVGRYQQLVVNTCRGFVTSPYDAEDLAQDVFIDVYQSIHNFRNESKLSTWLYRIAVNKSLNFVRKQKRNRMFENMDHLFSTGGQEKQYQDLSGDPKTMPDGPMQRDEDRKMLKQAINSLPKNQRIAFTLNKYMDLSYKEVAEVMNISLSSVESLLFRAKRNLQKRLLEKINNH